MTAALPLVCALSGCELPVRPGRSMRYCSPEHAYKAERHRVAAAKRRARKRKRDAPAATPGAVACPHCGKPFVPRRFRQVYCSAGCQQLRRNKRRQQDRRRAALGLPISGKDAAAPPAEPRQQPLRPAWRLEWHAHVKIRPAHPAPPKYYRPGDVMLDGRVCDRIGIPCEFRDDLNAIADHGSPGRTLGPPAAPEMWGGASPLARVAL